MKKQEFIDLFDLSYQPSYEDWYNNLNVFCNSYDRSLTIHITKLNKKNDERTTNTEELMKYYYDVFVTNKRLFLEKVYEMVLCTDKLKNPYNFEIPLDMEKDGVIQGFKSNKHNKLIRNINFNTIKDCSKTNGMCHLSIYEVLSKMMSAPKIYKDLFLPSGIKNTKDRNLKGIITTLKLTTNPISIFNPSVVGHIFRSLNSDKIFTPVLGWNSYQLGFHQTNGTEYVGTDVIPEVIKNGEALTLNCSNEFFDDKQTVNLYCCPSEELDARYNFSDKYKEHFDTVFLSPPYYRLELYPGEDQSTEQYQSYEEWLEKYWEATVSLSQRVLQKDGYFVFVIVDFYQDLELGKLMIANDLSRIAGEYFELNQEKTIKWSSSKMLHANEKSESGSTERMFIFRNS